MTTKNIQTIWGPLLLTILSIAILFLLLPPSTFAQRFSLPPVPGLASTNTSGNNTFNDFLIKTLIPMTKIIFQGVAVVFIFYSGSRLVFASGNDDTVKKGRISLLYALVGFIFLNIGELFVNVFVPKEGNTQGPNLVDWKFLIGIVISAIRGIAGTIAIVSIIIGGFRIVISGASGAEDAVAKQRTQILWSILGLIVIALAGEFQKIAFEGDTDKGISTTTSLIRLLLLFIVPLGFGALILGGFYFIFSGANDGLRTKGLKIIQGTIIAMVIIYASYTIVTEILKFAEPQILL